MEFKEKSANNWSLFSSERSAIMGFAILWIMIFHSEFHLWGNPLLLEIQSRGNMGVDIFLLMSGVGLYYSAERMQKTKAHPWFTFFQKRLIRIMPATIICLGIWYLYSRYTRWKTSIIRFVLDVTSASFWIDGGAPWMGGWYISLIFVLYLIYPLLFSLITESDYRKNAFRAALLIILDIALNTWICVAFPEWFEKVNITLGRVPVFIVGCFVAPSVKSKRPMPKGIALAALPTALICLYVLHRYLDVLTPFALWRYIYGIAAFCLTIVFGFAFHAIHDSSVVRVLRFFGNYTLELYLIHTHLVIIMCEQLLKYWKHDDMVKIAALLLSFGLSVLLHKVISFAVRKLSFKPSIMVQLNR